MGNNQSNQFGAVLSFLLAAGSYWALGILVSTDASSFHLVSAETADPMYLWMLLRCAAFGMAIAWCDRLASRVRRPWFSVAAGLTFIASWFAIAPLVPTGLPYSLLPYAGYAIGYVGLLLSLVPFLAGIQSWSMRVILLSASMAVGFLELLVIRHFPESVQVLAPVLIVALSATTSAALNRAAPRANAPDARDGELRTLLMNIPISMLVGFVALSVPLSFFRSYSNAFQTPVEWSLVTALALSFTIVIWALNKFWISLHVNKTLYVFCFASLLFVGMLTLSFLGIGSIAGSLIYAGAYLLRAYIYAAMGVYAREGNLGDGIRLFSIASIAIMVGHFIGLLGSNIAAHFSTSSFEYLFIVIIYAVFLAGYYFAFRIERSMRIAVEEPSGEQHAEEHVPDTLVTAIEELCDAAAQRYGLSERETDIVTLLMRGKSVNTIAEALVLSPNTVKSHMNRIYKKMRVHSREELMAAVEKCTLRKASRPSICAWAFGGRGDADLRKGVGEC
ncbi:response regulator transcription factor [Eggerthella sinensis]|uniref:response regulator transcription factor n=2 Tax=Eggerthella sinensis TaxID=242230 RepID=UPI00266DC16D|nr:LuxR C-terminal-related transcriptional regulator [Eggerthella sinensis]